MMASNLPARRSSRALEQGSRMTSTLRDMIFPVTVEMSLQNFSTPE